MDAMQLIAMSIAAVVLVVVSATALAAPGAIRDVALRETQRTQAMPLLGGLWYGWARSPWYLTTTRLIGIVALAIAVFLTVVLVRSLGS